MKKIIFLLAIIFMASFSFLSAQNLVFQNQDAALSVQTTENFGNSGEMTYYDPTRAEVQLGYTTVTAPTTYTGFAPAVGVTYQSNCVNFSAAQMANYVGSTLHTISIYVPALLSGSNPLMQDATGYRVWIKNTLDGPVLQEKDVFASLTLSAINNFTLTTPYTIPANTGLVIGFTVQFTVTTGGVSHFPFAVNAPTGALFPDGGFNTNNGGTNANAHGAGATWGKNTGRASLIWGKFTATPQANDLCAVSLASPAIKWVNNPSTFGVWVFNSGTTSVNNFTVELLNTSDVVIGTQTVTTALAGGAHVLVNVPYTPTTTGTITVKGRVVLAGDPIPSNNLAPEQLTQKIYLQQPVSLCDNSVQPGGVGNATLNTAWWALAQVSATNVAPFVGKFITALDIYICEPPSILGECNAYIRTSNTGTNLRSKSFTPVQGWNHVVFDTPYEITNSMLCLLYSVPVPQTGYPLGYTTNTAVTNTNYYSSGTGATWTAYTSNFAIIGEVVNTVTTDVTITTAVNPAGAGSVTGGGTQPSGSNFTLTATANSGYTFANWTPGGSTANPLTLTNVTANATYTANFTTNPVTCNPPTNLNVVYNSPTCTQAVLTWTPPVAKGGEEATAINPVYPYQKPDKATLQNGERTPRVTTQKPYPNTPKSKATIFFCDFESAPAPNFPTGWTVLTLDGGDGYYIWQNATVGYFPSGIMGATSDDYTVARNSWAFSPAIALTSGTTYNISFWLNMPGYDIGDYDSWEMKIGQAATVAGMTNTLISKVNSYTADWDWELIELTFTPTASGNYYLGLHAFSPIWTGDYIDIDDILVETGGTGPNPVSYNVYRDGTKINTAPVTTATYTDNSFTASAGHTWSVKAICPTTGESAAAEKVMPACAGSGTCDPPTNLIVTYNSPTCSQASLSWTAPPGGGGQGTPGTITTPAMVGSAQGGGIAFDMIAGTQPVTINEIALPIGGTGARTIHAYYRVGTACGNVQNAAVWLPIGTGTISVTVTSSSPANTNIVLPTPVTIPAGATYGFYLLTLTDGSNVIKYSSSAGGSTTCGATTITGSNADLTIKGGTGLQSATAPFVIGNVWESRDFTGVIKYTVGGGGGAPATYNVYRGTTKLNTTPVTTTTFVDNTFTNTQGYTWSVKAICPTTGESAAATKTMSACSEPQGDCNPPQNLTVDYALECGKATLQWEPPIGKKAGPDRDGWLKHCKSDEIVGWIGWGPTSGENMTAAIRFTPADLTAQGVNSGNIITKIALGIGQDITPVTYMELRIWEGGTSVTEPGTLVYTQPVTGWATFPTKQIVEIDLTTPFVVDATKELRIGWNVINTAGYPFGRESGPAVGAKGLLIHCLADPVFGWKDCYAWQGWNYNYVMKAYVMESGTQYNVYRNGNLLAGNIYGTKFVDDNFNPAKAHEWSVAAVCDGGGESGRISQSKPACNATPPGTCNPAKNLAVDYADGCTTANLTWTAPDGKKGTDVNPFTPLNTEKPERINLNSAISNRAPVPEGATGRPVLSEGNGGDLRGYADAYTWATDGWGGANYNAINLTTGALTPVSPLAAIGAFPTGEDYYDGDIYRLYENGLVVKVDETGKITTIGTIAGLTSNNTPIGLAYDWVANDGTWYFTQLNSTGGNFPMTQSLYKLTMPSLTKTLVGTTPSTSTDIIRGLAVGSGGTLYAIRCVNEAIGSLVTINKTNGTVTNVGSLGMNTWFGQDIAFDRQANILYAGVYDRPSSTGKFGKINTTTGLFTATVSLGSYCQYASLVITKDANVNLPKAPTNVTLTATGTTLTGTLAWTNPSQTINGTALTSITKMVILRDGAPFQEITTGVTVGAPMTLPVTVTTAGKHKFEVYAVTAAGKGQKTGATAVFGEVCEVEVNIDYVDVGDEVSWSLTDATGTLITGGGLQATGSYMEAGNFTEYVGGDVTFKIWGHDLSWYDNYVALTVKINGELVYSCSDKVFMAGEVVTKEMECGYSVKYLVYRDGAYLATTKATAYADKAFSSSTPHTWEVKVLCQNNTLSTPISATKPACGNNGTCNPPTNLDVVYNDPTCTTAELTWTPPVGKGANSCYTPKSSPITGPIVLRDGSTVSTTRNKTTLIPFKPEEGAPSKAPWDLLWNFGAATALGKAGNFSPFMWGNKLYIARWNPGGTDPEPMGQIRRYAKSGSTWVADGTITIPGIPNAVGVNIEGFATDGQFIYACNGSSNIFKINPATWTVASTISYSGVNIDGIAYDVVNNCFWVAEYGSYGGGQVKKVALTGGGALQTLTTTGGMYISDIAWENSSDGTPYLWMMSTDNINLHRWNLTTNAFTANAKSNATIPGIGTTASGGGLFSGIDETTGKKVLIGLVEDTGNTTFCYEIGVAGEQCPPISNLQYTVTGNTVNLTWTAAPGSPIGYEVKRNGNTLQTVTTTSFTDTSVPDGQYSYSVTAKFSGTCYPQAVSTPQFMVGNMCPITIKFGGMYSDSWTYSGCGAPGGVEIFVNGVSKAIVMGGALTSGSSGNYWREEQVLIPAGEVQVKKFGGGCVDWGELYLQVFDKDGDLVGGCATVGCGTWATGATIVTFGHNCGVTFKYNVYRDGALLVSGIKVPNYTDKTYNPEENHTWEVKVICTNGLSTPTTKDMSSCWVSGFTCAPIKNLTLEQWEDCRNILTWQKPDGKGAVSFSDPLKPNYIPTPKDLEKDAQKEEMIRKVEELGKLRTNPNQFGAQQSSTPLPDFFPSRGSTDPIYYGDSNGAVRKGTVGTPFPPVTVGSNGSFQQAYEYINGELYAARWSSGNQLGKINMTTGAWQNIGSIAQCDAASLCYNPANGLTYVFPFTGDQTEGTNWGTINLNTGAVTVLGNMAGQPTPYVAINNAGVAYAGLMGTNQFGTINLTSGAFTQIATAPFTAVYIQNMSFDRSTGLLYWMAQDGTNALYYEVDVTTTPVTFTLKGTHSTHWMAFTTLTEAGTPCPAVTNVVATLVPGTQNVNITWTASTPAPTNYEVYRGGTLLGTATGTSYSNTNVPVGTHIYTVKAIYPPANQCIPVGVNSNPVNVSEVLIGGCEAVVVGGGTASGYNIPINTFYRYSYTQQIYDATNLTGMVGKEINSISFEYIHATPSPKNPVTIYLGITTKNTFASTTDWVPVANLTQVFTGPLNFNNTSQWYTINFPQPFKYTGGNLVVAVLNNEGAYTTPPGSEGTFRYHTATDKTLHYRVDGTTPINPASIPAATARISDRNNVRFVACTPFGYNIYKNGDPTPIATVDKETYTDFTADYTIPNEYCITVLCEDGVSESAPVCITAPICKPSPCGIVQDLAAEYGLDCQFAKITWKAPILPKGKGRGDTNIPYVYINNDDNNAPQLTEEQKLAMENAAINSTNVFSDDIIPFTYVPSEKQPEMPVLPTRGNTAYAHNNYGTPAGYVSFNVSTPGTVTPLSGGTAMNVYGGECVNGVLYTYQRLGTAEPYTYNYLKINSTTGAIISSVTSPWSDFMSDMAYDYTTQTMYGTKNNNLYTINMATGAVTNLGAITGHVSGSNIFTLAIDLNGNMYGINSAPTGIGNLYLINKTTRVATLVGPTGKAVNYAQCMGFDHNDGTLYWCQCSATTDMTFRTVNVTTGASTQIASTGFEQLCFHVPYVDKPPCSAVTGVTAAVVPGTANVKVNWTPATGGPTSTEVLRDGSVIATLGGTANTYTDATATPGSHTYCVKAIFPPANDCNPVSVCAPAVNVPEIFPGGCEGKVVISGNGTTSVSSSPMYTLYGCSYNQLIFTEAELGLSPGQTISSVAFNYVSPEGKPPVPVAIFMGHTTKSEFAAATAAEFIPFAQLTKVYQKPTTLTAANTWLNFELDAPFTYEGGNLVVAVHQNAGNPGWFSSSWLGGSTGTYKNLRTYQDPVFAPGAMGANFARDNTRANIRFVVCEDQKEYNIYRDGVFLAKVKGNEYIDDIAGGMKPDEAHCWEVKYIREGEHGLECEEGAEVCLEKCAEDPCTSVEATIGTSTSTYYYDPLPGWYGWSRNIILLQANEINGAGPINKLAFNIYQLHANQRPMKIYLMHTNSNTLDAQYVWNTIKAQATLVYDAQTNFPQAGATVWQYFDLTSLTTFEYNGTQNLLVLVEGTGCTTSGECAAQAYYTTKTDCHWYSRTDDNPPNDAGLAGTRNSNRPNIKINIDCPPQEVDMAATKIHLCPAMVKTATPYDVEVTVKNNGLNNATNYKVEIREYPNLDNILASTTNVPTLAPGATATIIIPVVFSKVGEINIRGRVEIADDFNPLNNQTANLNLTVRPKDDDEIVEIPCPANVGAEKVEVPFNFYWKSSMVQSLYTEAEIGLAGGYIKDITWFYNSTATANVLNKDVKVYFAITNKTELAEWFPLDNFTQVYEGKVSVPIGKSELKLTLSQPFLYMGGNLVIMTERLMDTEYIDKVNAMTTVVGPKRSREYHSDTAPFNWTQAGTELNYISNIRLTLNQPPHGKIEGTASCAGIPVAGVKVAINEMAGIYKLTDANGFYKFGFVPVGTYSMTATKFGYFDGYQPAFEVKKDVTYTKDFTTICLLPEYMVFGVVKAADGTLIQGAKLTLTGYENYAATSQTYGEFEFPNVYAPKEYTLSITAKGYQPHTQIVNVIAHTNLGTIILYDVPFPPTNVVAVDVDPFAEISWEAPLPGGGFENIFDDAESYTPWVITNQIGIWKNVNVNTAMTYVLSTATWPNQDTPKGWFIFDPSQASPSLIGHALFPLLSGTKFFASFDKQTGVTNDWLISPELGFTTPFTFKFYARSMSDQYGLETMRVAYSTTGDNPTDFTNILTTVQVPTGWTLYSFTVPANAKYVAINNNSDDVWALFVDDIFIGTGKGKGDDENITIQHPVTTFENLEPASREGNPSNFIYTPNVIDDTYLAPTIGGGTRGILGYKLWRLAPGQEENPAAWSQLTNVPVPALVYTDVTWATAAMGHYKWAVKTCYHGGVESTPAFSNTLYKNVKVNFTVNITTNCGASPIGATVKLSNATNTYELTSTSTGIIFTNVYCGSYTLTVSLAGFTLYTATVQVPEGGGSHDALLQLIATAPTNLAVVPADCSAFLTWTHSAVACFTGYTITLNGNEVATGIKFPMEFMFTELEEGNYTAGVQANYGNGINSTITTIDFSVGCIGVKDFENGYNIYPNPTMDKLFVERKAQTPATIEIYNAMGMFINKYETEEQIFEVNVSMLATGTYFIRVTEGDITGVKSFVKK